MRLSDTLEQQLFKQGGMQQAYFAQSDRLDRAIALPSEAEVSILRIGEYPALQVKKLLA